MQTTYYNTHRMIWTESKNKVVDLDAYRRQVEEVRYEDEWDEPAALETGAALGRGKELERRAWALDICASLGVAVMTFSFALNMLLG